jgi:hypothetical protein
MRARVLAFTISLLLAAAALPASARNPWEGQPPYGAPIMTKQEKKTYWTTMRDLPSVEEQEAYWLAHVARMEERALERGVALPDPPKLRRPGPPLLRPVRPPYMEAIMTKEEVETYYAEVAARTDRIERMAYIAAHIERMQALGLERGIALPTTALHSEAIQATEKARKNAARAKPGVEPESGPE